MLSLKRHALFQAMAVVLSVLIAFEAGYVFAQEQTPEALFVIAKQDYANGDFAAAKETLQKAAGAMDESIPENRPFLGYVYLLLGASEENLRNTEAAQAAYAKARELLAEKNAAVEGINFTGLSLYLEVFGTPRQRTEAEEFRFRFDQARKAYFAGDSNAAKNSLEELASKLASLEGWMSLRGETYLLLGASYEKLNTKELAISYYCKAKEILGQGKTNEGLDLKQLKYYDQECRTVASRAGVKKGSSFGKLLGVVLTLALLGGAVWYLFFSPNAPFKPKGGYTSVTLKVTVTFKGLNSTGTRQLAFDGVNKLDEAFVYTQNAGDTSVCSDATSQQTYSYTFEALGSGFKTVLDYINWDYYDYIDPGANYKMLCSDWSFEIVSYKWESGKKDPGQPSIEGLDQLTLDTNTICTDVTPRIKNCQMEADLTFKAPSGAAGTGRVQTASSSLVRRSK